MNVIRQEIRTGLLVIFSLTVLVLVVLYLGAPGVFVPQRTFYIFVENAGGLKQGADVALAGRKIGQVMQLFSPVALEKRPAGSPNSEVLVEVRVNRSSKIYNDVKVQITSSSLLGEYYIDFTSGLESSGLAEGQHTFIGGKTATMSDVAPQLLAKLDPLIEQATTTLATLKSTSVNIARLTAPDGELPSAINQFRRVGANLEMETGPTGELHNSLSNIDKLTADDGKLSLALDNIRELTGADSALAHAMHNAEKFTGDLANNRDLSLTLANSRRATQELNSTLNELRFKFGSIASNLEQASDTVKRQPWRLIWPSTKRYDATPEPKKPATNALGGTPARDRAAR